MEKWIEEFRNELHRYNEALTETRETAKTIISHMKDEINHLYDRWAKATILNDRELLLEYLGNKVHVRAEIPLSNEAIAGRINCHLEILGPEDLTVLETEFSFDRLGNIDSKFTAYECANVLMQKLYKEFCGKGIMVKD